MARLIMQNVPAGLHTRRCPSAGLMPVRGGVFLLCLLLGAGAAQASESPKSAAELARMSIEELADIAITSVSKRLESLSDAAASVYVITNEDVRRSGAISIPEALRLAPNLQVARLSASTYAITSRGFNSSSSTNKLLVLIDGRTVYSPINSTVFWDTQDVLLEDIERIEVISGAGGTLWGSNAVTGVINVTTRHAKESSGALISVGAGSDERDMALRYGAKFSDDASFRLYGKSVERDHTDTAAGVTRRDAARLSQGGFRFDWGHGGDALTLQGDAYDGATQQPKQPNNTYLPNSTSTGGNLLGRWNRTLASGGTLQVQAYYDRAERASPGGFADAVDTYDLDVQHGFKLGDKHDLLMGGGYRLMRDHSEKTPLLEFLPANRDLKLSNLFIQDTITLSQQVKLTLGEKLEHNSYTGLESQPSARLAWKLDEHKLLWSAIARAVRTPARVDADFHIFLPILPIQVNPGFESERLIAYEVGYRAQPTSRLSYSVSTFYNAYDRLRSIDQLANGLLILGNNIEGNTAGVEMWGNFQVSEVWRLSAGVNALREHFHYTPQYVTPTNPFAVSDATKATANDPARQFQLRSSLNLRQDLDFDATVRAVGALPNPAIPGYVTMDARLGWRIGKQAELSLSGINLLGRGHQEFGAAPRAEIGRSVFVKLLWKS